jgi:hypothetical protein
MQQRSHSNQSKPYHKRKEPKKKNKILGILWYFLIGSETIYHIFKGLYLTAIFTVYEPFMKIWNTPVQERGVVGATIFSLDEWSYHFLYGLKGPSVLFGAYLLYRYTCYLSPFKPKKPPRKSNDRPIRSRTSAQQTR